MATLTIRLKDDLRDRIAEAAEAQGLPISDYIRGALEVHLSLDRAGDVGADRPEPTEEVTLAPFERKVLQLLHRNLLAAKGDLSDSYYDDEQEVRSIKVLENGFMGEYAQEFADIQEPISRSECELVWDIFDMFRVIQSSVRELGKDGWNQINVEDAEFHGSFQGFDFNDADESRLGNYARYLIKTDRWAEQEDAFSRENDSGNSHTQMLPTYRAMLRVFKPLWRNAVRGGFTRRYFSANDLEQVLLAAPGARSVGEQ